MSDVTVANFRALLPEFADVSVYNDISVNLWLGIANATLDELRWNDYHTLGVSLFVAHNLTLARRNAQASAGAGVPGGGGLVNQKTVGRVSVGNDTENTSVKNAGPWNLTTYGTQFIWYANLVGMGGQQITGPISYENVTNPGIVGVF